MPESLSVVISHFLKTYPLYKTPTEDCKNQKEKFLRK